MLAAIDAARASACGLGCGSWAGDPASTATLKPPATGELEPQDGGAGRLDDLAADDGD